MDGEVGNKGDVEERIGELVEGTLALGIVTHHLLHQSELLSERVCRLEEGDSVNCGGDVARRRGHPKAAGVGSTTSSSTNIITNTNTKNAEWTTRGPATTSPSSSPSRRRTPTLKGAASASSMSPSSSPSKRRQTSSPGGRASRPASASLQRSSPGKRRETVASRELNIGIDSVDAQDRLVAKEQVLDGTVVVDCGMVVVGEQDGARKGVGLGARSSNESTEEAAGELASNNDDGDGGDCDDNDNDNDNDDDDDYDDDDDDVDMNQALSPAIARLDRAVHLGDSGSCSQEQACQRHPEGGKCARDGAEEERCESGRDAPAPDHQLERDEGDQSSSPAVSRPSVAAADVADQGKVDRERWACVDLDVDSKTLERALMWMSDKAFSKQAERRPTRGDEEHGEAEEVDDATSSPLAHPSVRGLDQEGALSLLLFADFLQCESLIKASARALPALIDFPCEDDEQGMQACCTELSRLFGSLPPSVSLRIAMACPLRIGARMLSMSVRECDWWTEIQLEEEWKWAASAATYAEGRDADFGEDTCGISRYVGAQDRWDVLKAWLSGGDLGAGFLLKVVLLGDDSTVNRSEVWDAWGRVYEVFLKAEREREQNSDRFLSMAEPCLPEKLETWAYDNPDDPEHTSTHTSVLSSLVSWLRSIPGLIKSCCAPLPPTCGPTGDGIPFTALPSCVTWARPSLNPESISSRPSGRSQVAQGHEEDHVGGGKEAAMVTGWPEGVKVSALIVFGAPSGIRPILRGILTCPSLSSLTQLDFEGCEPLTDEDVEAACLSLPNLTMLDVKGAERLTDKALVAVSTKCTRLATLQIGGCKGLTDNGIDAFAKMVASNREQCASLVKFSMMNCSQLTNASLCSVAEHLTDLRDLCIYGCYRMTDDAIIRIKRSCHISRLNTSGCYKISDMGVRYLMQVRPSMLVYHKHRDFYKPLTERDMR